MTASTILRSSAADRRVSIAPEFYLKKPSTFRFLGDTGTSPSVGWAVAGGLLLGGVLGAIALGVVSRHKSR